MQPFLLTLVHCNLYHPLNHTFESMPFLFKADNIPIVNVGTTNKQSVLVLGTTRYIGKYVYIFPNI